MSTPPIVRHLTVAASWQQVGQEWILVLASDARHDEARLAAVTEHPRAIPACRWHWVAMGSTYWAADREAAMRQAELRLSMDSHKQWCDYAESGGLHPPY